MSFKKNAKTEGKGYRLLRLAGNGTVNIGEEINARKVLF